MEITELQNDEVLIQAYGIADFVKGIVDKVKEGYKLNYERNETYPQSFGAYYSIVLELDKEVKQDQEVQKPARKTKA